VTVHCRGIGPLRNGKSDYMWSNRGKCGSTTHHLGGEEDRILEKKPGHRELLRRGVLKKGAVGAVGK
jgi:hypothetical protein